MKNTRRRGKYRWIVFKKGAAWTGVALEFNIVHVGDDPNLVYLELQDTVRGYIEATQKITGFRESAIDPILNQKADKTYEVLWDRAQSAMQKPGLTLPSMICTP